MRVIVFFDLPTLTSADMREYRKFRKFLISSGFVMVQESVYSRIALNTTSAKSIAFNVRKNKPPSGLVLMLTITEKQYADMEFVVGDRNNSVIDSDERLVVL